MVRFIQSSDWQIGMKGTGLSEAGKIVRETRIESVHNIFRAASDHHVDFILLCGDIFEHNMVSQNELNKVVTIINQYPEIPIYLLPGNHDILGPDCIYNRDIFQRIKHLTILDKSEPIEVTGGTLHPCPIFSKFTTEDLTQSLPDMKDNNNINIGVAHGSLVGQSPVPDYEEISLRIEPSCIERTGLDYLALGHWHGYRIYKDNTGTNRIGYSGTHEQTTYNEEDAGYCLLVEIQNKGSEPKITPIPTGRLKWRSDDFEIIDENSITELETHLNSLHGFDMIRLNLSGQISLKNKNELDRVLEFQYTKFKNFRLKTDSLNIMITRDVDEKFDLRDPTLNQAEEYLRKLLNEEPDQNKKNIIINSLIHLNSFASEVVE